MIAKPTRAVAAVALLTGWGWAWSSAIEARQAPPRRWNLQIAKLRHVGDWDVAPRAIPNIARAVRENLRRDLTVRVKDAFPRDPDLTHFPLIYLEGDAAFAFDEDDRVALRRHLTTGGGTLFADAARGSAEFDAAFRKLVAALLPEKPLVPVPADDPLLTRKYGHDLADLRTTPAAGGKAGPAQLEGVKVDGRWAVLYSKLDIGCALDDPAGENGKGYDPEAAKKIATNVVRYATSP